MRKFALLFLVFFVLTLSGDLHAKEKKGAELQIQKKSGQVVQGELIAVKENSLLIVESESGADVSVSFSELSVVRIVKKSKALLGAGYGLLGGAILGGILGAGDSGGDYRPSVGVTGGAIWLAIPGVLIGAIGGAAAGADKVIKLEGLPMSGIKERMYDLRKEARVSSYK